MDAWEILALKNIEYVATQRTAALVELEAMKAENKKREISNLAPAYDEKDFLALVDKYQLGHNAVVVNLNNIR